MAGVINLALQVVRIGSGLTLDGDMLYATPSTDVATSVIAPNGDTLTLAGNDSLGGMLVLGVTPIITSSSAWQGLVFRVNNRAGDYTLTSTDLYVAFTGASAQAFTLPAAASHTGRLYIVKNRGTANLTLQVTGGGEIWMEGAETTVTLLAGEGLTLISDGTYWVAVSALAGVITP